MLIFQAPSSKSLSHRLLMGAALASGTSTVRRALASKDIEQTKAVLTAVGASFTPVSEHEILVRGCAGRPQGHIQEQAQEQALAAEQAVSCDMHESGTSCRLLTAILAAGRGRFRIHGAPRLHERPVGALTSALATLGIHITFEERNNCPPFLLETQGYQGQEASIDLDESSQYLSGLLLAAPCTAQGLTITLQGSKAVSFPYVALTLHTLELFGISFTVEQKHDNVWHSVNWRRLASLLEVAPNCLRFCVQPGQYRCADYTVEGDWSGASYFLAAGAVGKKPVRMRGLQRNSLQGDMVMLDILRDMGAQVDWEAEELIIYPQSAHAPLHGIKVDMAQCPDLVPTVAMLAAFATGTTRIHNVAHARIKESDRLAAPAAELRKVGVRVEEHDDGLTIHGLGKAPIIPEGTLFCAHNDHRMAMSCALFGLHGNPARPIHIDEPQVVQKSFPHFWDMWRAFQ